METEIQQAKAVRIFSDTNGESHFEDLEMPLPPVDFAPPAAPLKIALFLPVNQTLWLGVPVAWEGEEFHPSPRRQMLSLVQGKYEVTASDRAVRKFPMDSMLLLEDTTERVTPPVSLTKGRI